MSTVGECNDRKPFLMAEFPRSVAPNAKEVAMVLKIDSMAKLLVTLNVQNSAYFVVMALTPSQMPELKGSNCRLVSSNRAL